MATRQYKMRCRVVEDGLCDFSLTRIMVNIALVEGGEGHGYAIWSCIGRIAHREQHRDVCRVVHPDEGWN